jgi:Zinc carboxypeptidase
VHGNEPSSREACLIMARELAFATDARTIDILSNVTVLIVPTINGDGRAANTRGNSTGQDLNRDYSLIRQPETFGFVRMMRDYQPKAGFDGHEFGNSQAGDLPVLPPRHLNVAQPIFDRSKSMIEDWLYGEGSEDGWWFCPYGCQGGGNVGLSQETILRNTMGLKNVVGSLLEARSSGGPTRPNEGNPQNNRRRKAYSALYTYHRFLDFYRANHQAIALEREEAIEFQTSNEGPIVFRGSRPIPAFPPPHPGESPPPEENPSPDQILEDPPCGYLLSEEQYTGPRTDGPPGMTTTVAERIEAHGWRVRARENGYLVPMAQPERGLIPLLLDAQAAEEWVDAVRMYPPRGFPEGVFVPDGACGRGRPVPSTERAQYDATYRTD